MKLILNWGSCPPQPLLSMLRERSLGARLASSGNWIGILRSRVPRRLHHSSEEAGNSTPRGLRAES